MHSIGQKNCSKKIRVQLSLQSCWPSSSNSSTQNSYGHNMVGHVEKEKRFQLLGFPWFKESIKKKRKEKKVENLGYKKVER